MKGKLLEKVVFSIPDIPVLHTRKLLIGVGGLLMVAASPEATGYIKRGTIFLLERALAALKG